MNIILKLHKGKSTTKYVLPDFFFFFLNEPNNNVCLCVKIYLNDIECNNNKYFYLFLLRFKLSGCIRVFCSFIITNIVLKIEHEL